MSDQPAFLTALDGLAVAAPGAELFVADDTWEELLRWFKEAAVINDPGPTYVVTWQGLTVRPKRDLVRALRAADAYWSKAYG